MTKWFVHIDNYVIEHADHCVEEAHDRGLSVACLGPVDQIGRLTRVDCAIPVDTSDAQSVTKAIEELEIEGEISGIRCMFGLPDGQESLAAVCARLRNQRGLPGPDAAALDMANVKSLSRACLDRHGLGNVRWEVVHSADQASTFAEKIGKPIILKPLTGVGAGFVRRCTDPTQAYDAFETITGGTAGACHRPTRNRKFVAHDAEGDVTVDPQRSLLAEEWIDGREISVECVVLGDRVLPLVVNDKLVLDEDEFTVREPLLITPPIRMSGEEIRASKDYATDVIQALGLRSCICHVELRLTPNGEPILLEINPRIGAGCVRDALKTFWNTEPSGLDVDIALGRLPRISRFERTNQHHVMIFLFTEKKGTLTRIDGLEKLTRQPGVLCVRPMSKLGQAVDGRFEEQFVLGVWRRLDGLSPEMAYQKTKSQVTILVE